MRIAWPRQRDAELVFIVVDVMVARFLDRGRFWGEVLTVHSPSALLVISIPLLFCFVRPGSVHSGSAS